MRNQFFIIFLLFSEGTLLAQSNSTGHKARWQIGLDVLPFFDTSYNIKNTILFRKVISENSSLRSKLGLSFEHIRNRPNDLPETSLIIGGTINSYASIGIEKYLSRDRVSVYFGGEIFGSYLRDLIRSETDTRNHANPPTIYKIRDLYRSIQTGVNGLTGVNILILPKLSVSFEGRIKMAYRWEQGDYQKYVTEDYILSVYGGRTIKRYILNIDPFSSIYILYEF